MELIVIIFGFGYLLQHLGMILQILRISKLKSAESVSVDTLILYLFSTISRVIWTSDLLVEPGLVVGLQDNVHTKPDHA